MSHCFRLFFVLWVCVSANLRNARADIDAARVNRAIDRGVGYLRSSQRTKGGWDEFGGASCGLSSLCTLAMLNAGVSRDDPAIRRAMTYLRATVAEDTYSVSLQTLVYCQLGAAGDLPRIRNNVAWLTETQLADGSWSYGKARSFSGDPSNAQFALLALGAAQDRGVEVDPNVFEKSIDYWIGRQRNDGGWAYGGGSPTTGSMTCAGIASLVIANGRLGNSSSKVNNGQIECCGGGEGDDDPIALGIKWLANRFSVEANPGAPGSQTYYYYLYALERVGRLSGRRFIGGYDWYREGAQRLIDEQDSFKGFWVGSSDWQSEDVATSFALLFLSKGKRQVVVGQLEAPGVDRRQWQPHPDALRQLVRHVERAWGRDLTWQTVRLENATVSDLLQTPVLVISGKETLSFSDDDEQLLNDYVDQGGTILFDASGGDGCGNAANFQNSVANLCSKWYPGSPLERLPATHPIWTAERPVDIDAMPEDFWVYGVQACCRTAVFFVPQSLTCRWELGDRLFQRGDRNDPVRQQIDHSIRIGQNLIAYSTGRELKDKLESQLILEAEQLPQAARGVTRLAQLNLSAGGEDARRALPNVATLIRAQTGISIQVPDESVGFQEQELSEVFLLWVHGRREFKLTADQREELRKFIERGGVIFGTAICGDDAFAESFRREFGSLVDPPGLRSLPADHPLLTTEYLGYDVRTVTIRRISRGTTGQQIRKQKAPPVLEFAETDGVVSIVFSPLDLSCALESQNSVQCPGYGTEDAAKIVTNIVKMAINQ